MAQAMSLDDDDDDLRVLKRKREDRDTESEIKEIELALRELKGDEKATGLIHQMYQVAKRMRMAVDPTSVLNLNFMFTSTKHSYENAKNVDIPRADIMAAVASALKREYPGRKALIVRPWSLKEDLTRYHETMAFQTRVSENTDGKAIYREMFSLESDSSIVQRVLGFDGGPILDVIIVSQENEGIIDTHTKRVNLSPLSGREYIASLVPDRFFTVLAFVNSGQWQDAVKEDFKKWNSVPNPSFNYCLEFKDGQVSGSHISVLANDVFSVQKNSALDATKLNRMQAELKYRRSLPDYHPLIQPTPKEFIPWWYSNLTGIGNTFWPVEISVEDESARSWKLVASCLDRITQEWEKTEKKAQLRFYRRVWVKGTYPIPHELKSGQVQEQDMGTIGYHAIQSSPASAEGLAQYTHFPTGTNIKHIWFAKQRLYYSIGSSLSNDRIFDESPMFSMLRNVAAAGSLLEVAWMPNTDDGGSVEVSQTVNARTKKAKAKHPYGIWPTEVFVVADSDFGVVENIAEILLADFKINNKTQTVLLDAIPTLPTGIASEIASFLSGCARPGCGQKAKVRCGHCDTALYCSSDCAGKHWPSHH